PEFLRVAIKRGAARDERPELPAELAMDVAKRPPTAQEMLAFGGSKALAERVHLSLVLDVAFQLLLQRVQDSGHAHQYRHPFAPDSTDYFGGLELFLENYRPAQKWRQQYSQELPKDVAQRQQVKKPYGMDQSLVFQIGPDLALQWGDIGEHVAMCDDDAFGFGSRTGGEDDLKDIVWTDARAEHWSRRTRAECVM